MSSPRPPRGRPTVRIIETERIREDALDERESILNAPRMGDAALLAILVPVLLGCGLWLWHVLGPSNDRVGRAFFFGLALVCALWVAVVYTVKLSLHVRVGPHGLAIVRGPWRTELAWREVARLVERAQTINGERYRWVVALAHDGRRLQVREDMVMDYERLRREIHQRHRLWRDHGGTWGTSNTGPFTARETLSPQVSWWGVLSVSFLLTGLYFSLLLAPETGWFGLALLALAVLSAALSVRAVLQRQTYVVDTHAIESRSLIGTRRLAWQDVSKVERSQRAFGKIVKVGIIAGQILLKIVAHSDPRMRSFEWRPRVPEYLTLRGTGRLVRVSLQRLESPDEALAWIEYYERIGRRLSSGNNRRRNAADAPASATASRPLLREPTPTDLSSSTGPLDPWGSGHASDADIPPALAGVSPSMSTMYSSPSALNETPDASAEDDAWLRGAPPSETFDDDEYDDEYDDDDEDDGATEIIIPAVHAPPTARREPVWQPPRLEQPPRETLQPPPSPQIVPPPSVPQSGQFVRAELPPSAPPQSYPSQTAHEQEWQEWAARAAMSSEPQRHGGDTFNTPAYESEYPYSSEELQSDPLADELDSDAAQQPTDAISGLADAFAPWRENNEWKPPQLPRFGPANE